MYPGENSVRLSKEFIENMLAEHVELMAGQGIKGFRIISVESDSIYGIRTGGYEVKFTTDPVPEVKADPALPGIEG
jgi:hypothetical protein